MVTNRKFRNFIWTVILLFPFIMIFLFLSVDGYGSINGDSQNGYISDVTNVWGYITVEGSFGSLVLDSFMPLGFFSSPFLERIFLVGEGFVPFLETGSLRVLSWFVDYYILVPFLYLFIQLFTFIPSMLIRFMDKLKKENER